MVARYDGLEQYAAPGNEVTATYMIDGAKYECTSENFNEKVPEIIADGFSHNVVEEYNRMIETRRGERGRAISDSSVVETARLYSDNHSDKGTNPITHIDASAYMDIAIHSAMAYAGAEERSSAGHTSSKCKGIARTGRELSDAYRFSSGYSAKVPADNTIKFYQQQYDRYGLGNVGVDLSSKDDLKNHLQTQGIRPGARVVCDVKEPHQITGEVWVVQEYGKKKEYWTTDPNGQPHRLDPQYPHHKALLEQAQKAEENQTLRTWQRMPRSEERKGTGKGSLTVTGDYIVEEKREYMYTGTNEKGEPLFSRLTNGGGDLNVPLSELPITHTEAVIDNSKLCAAKAREDINARDCMNPDIVAKYVPNAKASFKFNGRLAESYTPEEGAVKAHALFCSTYNPENQDIRAMLTGNTMDTMRKDQHDAMALQEQREGVIQIRQHDNSQQMTAPEQTGKMQVNPALMAYNTRQGGR